MEHHNILDNMVKKRNQSILSPPNNKSLSPKELRALKFHKVYYDSEYLVNCLEKDLRNYETYISMIIETKKPTAEKIIHMIKELINSLSNNYKVELYGSYSNGLCLPWSDLDFVIMNNQGNMSDVFFLKRVYNTLLSQPWVVDLKIIENTSVPLIKVTANEEFLNFNIDISMQADKHQGLKCVELVQKYLKEYKELHPLVLALKTLLKNANLNNPYTGGLSSYGLILMVVSYIQSKYSEGGYPFQENNLSKTFIGFLSHFGLFFDYGKYIIIAYPPSDLLDSTEIETEKESALNFGSNSHDFIIVDPLNKQNNVAKSTFKFMNIKKVFMMAFLISKEDCECGCHYGCAPKENEIFETEHCILKRMFNAANIFMDTDFIYN
ncbi:MAG: nucleotidyltransferase domain-containing protein [archaeon]|nr:nucleotidyltransferase domain-containing protein [archaeon]